MESDAKHKNQIFIVTGMSGAGKSQALKCFEDLGFYCVDNLPVALIKDFTEEAYKKDYLKMSALGIDIREGRYLRHISTLIEIIRNSGINCRILFLDASDEVLTQRFSETRHRHPLGKNISEAIREERERLSPIKTKADKVIDTSKLTLGELKERIASMLSLHNKEEMKLTVISFGYKYGIPLDADIVMDVRFLPNPYYVPELKNKTGLDREIRDYLISKPGLKEFLKSYSKQLQALIPLYIKEGKSYLTIATGCTGGKHRSVFIAAALAKILSAAGFSVADYHRDIKK